MLNELVKRYPALTSCKDEIEKAAEMISLAFKNGNKLMLCGNGGSCADCEHIVGELMKGFLSKRSIPESKKIEMRKRNPGISEDTLSKLQMAAPAISLPSFVALNAAFCNDVDSELVYAQELMGLGNVDDILLCISTSGNSKNCKAAAETAKALGVKVISLTGATGGKLKGISDICICAPETETYKVQELHLPIYHYICMKAESNLFGN